MKVIVLASQKGGVGKSTLTGNLGVAADLAGDGPSILIDTDPQGSLSAWWNAREACGRRAPPSRSSENFRTPGNKVPTGGLRRPPSRAVGHDLRQFTLAANVYIGPVRWWRVPV